MGALRPAFKYTGRPCVGLKMRVAGDGGEILSRMGVATVHLLLLVSFIEPN